MGTDIPINREPTVDEIVLEMRAMIDQYAESLTISPERMKFIRQSLVKTGTDEELIKLLSVVFTMVCSDVQSNTVFATNLLTLMHFYIKHQPEALDVIKKMVDQYSPLIVTNDDSNKQS